MSSTWNLNHRKGMHVALNTRLSHWSTVIFIESPFSILYHTFFKFRSRFITMVKKTKSPEEIKSFAPVCLFHHKVWKKFPFTLKMDRKLVSAQLRKFMHKKYIDNKIIAWANSPFDYSFIKLINPRNIVYDYYDNFSYDNDGNFDKLSGDLDQKLIKESDLIFCTAKVMYDAAKSINDNAYYVPNGHNLNLSQRITKADLKTDGKVIGYLGNVRDWIDFDLIEKLLESLNDKEYLFFIGPVEKNISGKFNVLKKNSQFRHIPAVQYSNIFNYIKSFDIGIIPFKVNKFTEGVLPNKFFEYIAADIPIVSTALPDLLQFKDIINVAKNNDEFVNMCTDKNIKLNKDDSGYERIRSESTWDKRAEFIESKVKNLLANN